MEKDGKIRLEWVPEAYSAINKNAAKAPEVSASANTLVSPAAKTLMDGVARGLYSVKAKRKRI